MTPEAVALAERLVALDFWVQADDSLPDLDHPSNEGHLRLLAEEVCGQKAALMPVGEGWALVVMAESRNRVVIPRTLGKGPTPGQAYAAAIVAHYEGERA